METAYRTVAAAALAEFFEKRSRFIGHIAPVATEEEAAAFLGEVRAAHREASHNCYAYVLRAGQTRRFSDDGEPSGTAGRPILEVLQKEELTDVAVVVTRYFGGTLLGTGGLARAYTQGAKSAVEAATVLNMRPAVTLEVDCDYHLYGKITYILPKYGVVVRDTRFAEGVGQTLLMEKQHLPHFERELEELSGGTVRPLVTGELFAHFD